MKAIDRAFVAFLDTCVQIRWSPDVLDELERTYMKKSKVHASKPQAGAKYLLGIMADTFPEAMVERDCYAHIVSAMPNDEKDRHVLAAAIASRADVLVTANLKDFCVPAEFCYTDIQHPDDFQRYQLGLAPQEFFYALKNLASNRHKPMNSVLGILHSLQKTVPQFVSQAQTMLPDLGA